MVGENCYELVDPLLKRKVHRAYNEFVGGSRIMLAGYEDIYHLLSFKRIDQIL